MGNQKLVGILIRSLLKFNPCYWFLCWLTLQGSPQWVSVEFEEGASLSSVSLQFQGGFCGKECEIEINGDQKVMDFFPEDNNRVQSFSFPELKVDVKKVRVIFKSSSDFYGRITLYSLELYS